MFKGSNLPPLNRFAFLNLKNAKKSGEEEKNKSATGLEKGLDESNSFQLTRQRKSRWLKLVTGTPGKIRAHKSAHHGE